MARRGANQIGDTILLAPLMFRAARLLSSLSHPFSITLTKVETGYRVVMLDLGTPRLRPDIDRVVATPALAVADIDGILDSLSGL